MNCHNYVKDYIELSGLSILGIAFYLHRMPLKKGSDETTPWFKIHNIKLLLLLM